MNPSTPATSASPTMKYVSNPNSEIEHVSDTALMVAACRAMETQREGGLVHDPFAARLAGERGMAIAQALPMLPMMCFGVGVRSAFMDRLVMHTLEQAPVETVLSLGAGLDSRPWRLNLPAHLRWIEADLPPVLHYKSEVLSEAPPRCKLETVAVDVNDPGQRRTLFEKVGPAPALMITEGLLTYLPASTVEAIAVEAAQWSGIRYWLMDIQTPAFARMVRMDTFTSIQNVRAAESLDGSAIYERCRAAGWQPVQQRRYVVDVGTAFPERVKELSALRDASVASGIAAPPPPEPVPQDDITGVHLLGHNGNTASQEVDLLKRAYEAFNARDLDGALATMHPDVFWANGMEGGHVRGHAEVRSYWTRQWAMIDPRVDPTRFSRDEHGRTVVEVHQVVKDMDGNLLLDKSVGHIFTVESGLIQRFDIRDE